MDSNHGGRPLSHYMLFIGSFESVGLSCKPLDPRATNEAVNFIRKENPEFEFIPPGGPRGQDRTAREYDPETQTGPVFGIRWDHRPKDGEAFILGSVDPEYGSKSASACDFAVAPNNQETGISRKQIALNIYPLQNGEKRVTVKLTCLRAPVWISRPSAAKLHNDGQAANAVQTYLLSDNEMEPIDGLVGITLRSLKFEVWIPSLSETGYAERRSLASDFERACAMMPPTRLPHIADGPDTLCDNIRSAAKGKLCIYDSRTPSRSTPDVPFFKIWYGGVNKWAWQPCSAGEEETKNSLAEKEELVRSLWERSEEVGYHPLVYRFHDTAAYRARGYEKTFQILPWAIGDELPGETMTLPNYLRGNSGRDAVDRGLAIFQNICSAVSFVHSRCVAHGHLSAHHVLLTAAKGRKRGVMSVRLYGFKASGEKAEAEDNITLGRLGVMLLSGHQQQLPGPDEDIRAWIAVAEKSDEEVRKVLRELLQGTFSAQDAKHHVSGIVFCKGLVSPPESRKRRTTNPPDAPTKQSRRLPKPAPTAKPASHTETRAPIGTESAPGPPAKALSRQSEPEPEVPDTQNPNQLTSQEWAELLPGPRQGTGLFC